MEIGLGLDNPENYCVHYGKEVKIVFVQLIDRLWYIGHRWTCLNCWRSRFNSSIENYEKNPW